MITAIAARRLRNQRLFSGDGGSVAELVAAFGAVQAQDYAAAKWALALRVAGTTETDIDAAFDSGRLLRTHVMRPTWHFVEPSMIRWLLALTASRVHASCASQYRALEIDTRTRRRSHRILASVLRDGQHLTRAELGDLLDRGGVRTDARRLAYLLMAAELDAVICSGARRGRQLTYALFEERVPSTPTIPPKRAAAELARRYLMTHGPATARDFAWWSGMTVAGARSAIETLGSAIASETIGGLTYWSADTRPVRERGPAVFLLPAWDEYVVAYRDREAVPYNWAVRPSGGDRPPAFVNPLVAGGQIAGTWRRRLTRRTVVMEVMPRRPLNVSETRALERGADRYAAFAGRPVLLQYC